MAETFVKDRPLPTASQGLSATAGTERGKVTVDDAVVAMARFANGALGTFEATRFALGHKNGGAFEINGTAGSMRFHLQRPNELEVFEGKDGSEGGFRTILATDASHPYAGAWWPPGHVLGWEHSHVHQIVHLLDAIAHDRMPVPNLVDGLKNQAVLEAMGQSMADGRWHDVERVA
jgi:predicted dehydrogenase